MSAYILGVFVLVCATLLPWATQGRFREHYVDLLTMSRVPSANPIPEGRRLTVQQPLAVAPHDRRPEPSIVILAPQLDRTAYNWGDPFVCEWVIENQGTQPVKFPIQPMGDQIDREMPGARVAVIALLFVGEQLAGETVGIQELYGAESVPGSLVVVGPGERVRIRASSKWSLMSLPKVSQSTDNPAHQVKATLQMARQGSLDLVAQSDASVIVSIIKVK